jgi:hypothetical protein
MHDFHPELTINQLRNNLTSNRFFLNRGVYLPMIHKGIERFETFTTKINGLKFVFQADWLESCKKYAAEAYLNDRYCNTAYSDKSTEDAILNLVRVLESK